MRRPLTNICINGFRLWPGSGIGSIVFFMAAIFITSCQSSSKTDDKKVPAGKFSYNLPMPGNISPEEFERIRIACEQWYDSTLKERNFNGSILVAKKGKIIFEKYRGTGHINGTDTISANTPTHIASVTKTFTAMAVLKLVQDGKAGLDDELSVYFPNFNYPGVTIRSLLNHRSGLPNYLYFMDELGWDKNTGMNNKNVFDYLVNRKQEIKNISAPNHHFSYCNTNYALLALLIEKLTGTTYPQFISKTIFEPLQMTHSFVYTPADSSLINPSYDWKGGLIPMNSLDPVYGDKNIYSTPGDLLKWDRLLRTGLFINPQLLQQAYTAYSNEKPGIKNYGLGWRMNIYPDGNKIIYHNGWWHGNNASFIRLLDEDVTIIAMGNRFCRCVYKVKNLLQIFNPAYRQVPDDESDNNSLKTDSTDQAIAPKNR